MNVEGVATKSNLAVLRRRMLWVGAGITSLTISLGLFFESVIDIPSGWLLMALLSQGVVFWFAGNNLELNHAPDGEIPAPYIGLPNIITLFRGGVIAWITGFVTIAPGALVDPPGVSDPRALLLAWLPALFYGIVVAMDTFDGSLARRRGSVTALGARLDSEYDGLGILVGIAVGIFGGTLPLAYLAVGLARYVFLAGYHRRKARNLATFELPSRRSRRVLASVQMAFIAVALSPAVGLKLASTGAVIVGIPYLLGFFRDWLYLSGRLN